MNLEQEDKSHRTQLSKHLCEAHTSCDYMKYWSDSFSVDALLEIFVSWVFNCRNEELPPDEFFDSINPLYKGDKEMTMAMLWIRFRKTLPPLKILHGDDARDYEGRTLLMLWLEYVSKVIPKELIYNIYAHDNLGRTAAMVYIDVYMKVPPISILHDPAFKDKHGKTLAMHYIESTNESLPDCLLHSPYIADNQGNTLIFYAIRYLHKFVEPWMISNVYRNRNGDTLIMFALKYYRVIMDDLPNYIYHDPYNIKNNQNESLYDIVEKYCYGTNRIDELLFACDMK